MKKSVLFLLVVVILISFFFIYTAFYYKASSDALSLLEEETVIDRGSYLEIGSGEPIIFYPGAKVEPVAYLPLLTRLSSEGYRVFLMKMPFNLAIFGINRADTIFKNHPEIESAVMMGHSLGGAMASSYTSKHDDRVEALILLGAYPYGDVDKDKTLSIIGSLDSALEKIEEDDNLVVIQGGNHAQVGDYGEQKGDKEATITRREQQEQTVDVILTFLRRRDVTQ